jgi:hypothetical protein
LLSFLPVHFFRFSQTLSKLKIVLKTNKSSLDKLLKETLKNFNKSSFFLLFNSSPSKDSKSLLSEIKDRNLSINHFFNLIFFEEIFKTSLSNKI